MMQEIRTDEELPVLTAKDERLRVSGYRCGMSNQTTVFSHVGKITSSWEECPPSFPVTVSEVVAVKEQMGKVISRVNAKVPAGDNEGEEERGNVSSGLVKQKSMLFLSITHFLMQSSAIVLLLVA